MMQATVLLAVAVAAAPTFHADVQPILIENCVDCHKPQGENIMGMVAPMSLRTYDEVRPWAKAIARAVESKQMPPWHADESFHGVFANERTLSAGEIDTIASWAESGAKRGNPSDAPELPEPKSEGGWVIGEPDLIVEFPEPYLVRDHVEDEYHNVYINLSKEQLPEDKWIKGMEFRPGSEAVHHIVIFTDDYRESIGFPMGMLGGMGPGTDATVFPEGYGRALYAGTSLTFNMHYHKEPGPGTAVYDQSSIAFTFHDEPVQHEVNWGAVGTTYFSIPPHDANYEVQTAQTFSRDTMLLALFPHTHLRGKASRYIAYYPDGTEETLLHVPAYDFNWQTNYIYKEPKRIPAGTKIEVTMWYDNSEERARITGIDPSRTVYFGEPTTDEMMFGWIDYADAKPMDSAKGD